MSLPTPSTTNRTSFAVALMDAVALYLDGVAEIGEARSIKFTQAKTRAATAVFHSDIDEEQEMAAAIMLKITDFERRRLHV